MNPSDKPGGQEPVPEVTIEWVDPGRPAGRPPSAPGPTDPRTRRRSLMVGALIATVVLAGVLIGLALNSVREADRESTGGEATADSASTQPQDEPASSAPSPAAEPAPNSPSPTEPPSTTPPEPPSKLAPPAAVRGRVKVVKPTRGVDDCRATNRSSGYENYPAATCRFFENTKGLRTKEKASEGSITVACQRDLKKENRKNKFGGTNTWWVWTTSDDGTWDWFPETSVDEGASDKPIGGVALCR